MRKFGILAHPTSVPSRFGVGGLGSECRAFIDYVASTGAKLWQILPLGHTGFGDSPYQSFSAFAGNPLMIAPELLAEDGLLAQAELDNYEVPVCGKTDYENGLKSKTALLKLAVQRFDFKDKAYKAWYKRNKFWLDDYALFMAAKNYFIAERDNTLQGDEFKAYKKAQRGLSEERTLSCYYGGAWNSFPEELRDRDPEAIKSYTKKFKADIRYWCFVQYVFFKQWADIKVYANEKGIEIIGDIPIFVALDSADTWAHREMFDINTLGWPNKVAGVPPDYFSEKGQLWGNPLYNWAEIKHTGYKWWLDRIKALSELCDIVRIDHFRAFDSYYSIAFNRKDAVKGKWLKGPGRELFDKISEISDIEIIAEDLGDLIPSVYALRDSLGLPGMKILQFAFGSDSGNPYLPFNFDTSNCVAYTGTHDNDTTVGWYNSTDERTKDRFRRILNSSGEDCAWDLIRYCMASNAKYAIIPLQDILREDSSARMNLPGVGNGNWAYRFELSSLTKESAETLKYYCELFNR